MSIDVNRSDSYSLSVGGTTAVRYNTNIHAIKVKEEDISQKDVYANLENESILIDTATWSAGDKITYTYDKDHSITLEHGVDGVDETNVVQKLRDAINNDPFLSLKVDAYNGQYSFDEDGNKVLADPQTDEHYLIIESKIPGKEGKFESRITVEDDISDRLSFVQKNDIKSVEANNDIHFEIFDKELELSSGNTKSMLDNVDTTSQNNKFTKYKEMLDNFAKSLADMSHSYIDNGNGDFISGDKASLSAVKSDRENIQTIGLFSGASVETLEFNKSVVSNLTQNNLDYLASTQWNEDIDIDGTGENLTSFSKYLQKIKVTVSADKENVDYAKQTQTAVTKSLLGTYEKLTKVNKDDEMINLIKFQASYEANAKLITIVDEMLATILGMKR